MGYQGNYPPSTPLNSTQLGTGVVTTDAIANGAVVPADLSTGAPYWDSSGNVGIGTSSPGQKLTVYSASGDNRIRMQSAGSVNTGIEMISTAGTGYFDYNNQNFNWYTNGATRMTLDSSGNVGIGTTSPATKLHLLTPSATAVGLRAGNSASYAEFQVDASGNSQLIAPGGVQIFNTNGSERMRIDSSGNVGIGTTSPAVKLSVYNNSATNTFVRPQNTLAFVDVGPLADGSIYMGYGAPASGTGMTLGTSNSTYWRVLTNGSEVMRIDSSGNVGIGTNSPSYLLSLSNGGAETAISLQSTSSGGKNYGLISGGSGGSFSGGRFGLYSWTDSVQLLAATSNTAGSAGGTTGRGIGFAHAGIWIDRGWSDNPSFTITNTSGTGAGVGQQGTVRFHGTNVSWASYPSTAGSDFSVNMQIDGSSYLTSDARSKINITTISNALDIICSLDGKRYQRINSDGYIQEHLSSNGYKYGFIAQEIERAGHEELYKYDPNDDDGTDGYNNAYAVDYQSLTAVLVNAVKELKLELDALKGAS